MIKIKVEVETEYKKKSTSYETNKWVSLKQFREIWNILKKEIESELDFYKHYHGKEPRK